MRGESAAQSSVRVADAVAATLSAHGAEHAFGMPGGEVVTLIDGLVATGIGFHLARHETAAAMMAAGVATRTGRPAMLVTTVGPGLANAVNGIADASQERIPLIVLSGIVDRPTRARYTHQVIDQARMLNPLVKAHFEIEPESAAETVARAIAIALTDPMGPVHLDLSPAVAAMAVAGRAVVAPPAVIQPDIAMDDPSLASFAARLATAERPIIIAGLEAARAGAGEAITRLAETLSAPIVTTYKGKGLVDEAHPLSLGAAGLSPAADGHLLPLLRQADLVLAIGYDPIEMRLGWLDPVDQASAFVELTATPVDHAMHTVGLRLVGRPDRLVDGLLNQIEGARSGWPGSEPADVRAALSRQFKTAEDWGPHAIIDVLNEMAGDDTVVTVDSGAHRILLSQKWRARKPLHLLQSAGFCTMAAALPLAIGAKLAEPEGRVMAVMGDGGLDMCIGELATLRDIGLPITVVVFQDDSLALIALKQAQSGLAPVGVNFGANDYAVIARGFGGHGVNVTDANALRAELAAAHERDTFTLIACRFDAASYRGAF